MSIYKRKSGRYAVLIDLDPTATGGRRRKSIGTYRTRKEAEVAERKALEARDRGIDLDPKRVTLAEVAERYFQSVRPNLAPASIARDEEHWRMHIAAAVGGMPVASLKPAHLAELYARLRSENIPYAEVRRADGKVTRKERLGKPLGALTLLRVHRFMHRLLGWAERMNLVARNVARAVEAPKATPSPARALSADQVAAVLAASERSPLHSFFIIAATTGMRRGEIGAVTWEAIDLERGTVAVRQAIGEDRKGHSFVKSTKSGRERCIPLSALATATLKSHRAEQRTEKMRNRDKYFDQGLVFADEYGGMIDLDAVSKAFSAFARKAGIVGKGLTLHSCRHFSASQALAAGNDVATVSKLLGHSSARMTLEVYAHVLVGAQERAVTGIEQAIMAAQARLTSS